MKTNKLLFLLLLAFAFFPGDATWARGALQVVKSGVNAESENAEFCLEFDKALAQAPSARLAAALRLETDSGTVVPQNVIAAGTSLCLFPLKRGQFYRLDVAGLRGADGERMTGPYHQSFTIPDRSPSLAFVASNGGVNGFGAYDAPLHLRAVNVAHVKITVYRVAGVQAMARAWQDRAQTALAPSESAYLARDKGQKVWQGEKGFAGAPNVAGEQQIFMRDQIANLAPGLYLIVVDAESADAAGSADAKPASKGLAPMAAAWFVKSDFSLRAARDDGGVHVFAAATDGAGVKNGIRLVVVDKHLGQSATALGGADGVTLIPYPAHLDDKSSLVSVIGLDKAGNVAFADIGTLPALSKPAAPGAIGIDPLFAIPGGNVAASMATTSAPGGGKLEAPGILRLLRGGSPYADFAVPPLVQEKAALSFPAPAAQGAWALRWQKSDGALLAEAPLRVTANADAPHLEAASDRDILTGGDSWTVTIKSVASSGKPTPLVGGQASLVWQKLDPATLGWKGYHFGVPAPISDAPAHVADFVTDLQGTALLRLTLPPRPSRRGLYQAVLRVTAEPDSGVASAPPLVLPLRPESTAIGIKPLAGAARFAQNSAARFSLIGLSLDGKPREVSGLSYQVYEEGRSFAWYQDEGRWKYKPEPQLRPIGGGGLSIRADGSSTLEWPVTAGNYRLEILDRTGKTLAQALFSAGWDSAGVTAAPALPLSVNLPKILRPGVEAVAHVELPEPAMLTAIIADTRIREVVHEFRAKGDNAITFTPGADWQGGVSLSVEATPQQPANAPPTVPLRAVAEASIAQGRADDKPHSAATAGVEIVAPDPPAALILRKGEKAALIFGVENLSATPEAYFYAFAASPGLRIEDGQKGRIMLGGRQSQSLALLLSAGQAGVKTLRLEVAGGKGRGKRGKARIDRSWALAVLPEADMLRSVSTASVAPGQALIRNLPKKRGGAKTGRPTIAFVSRRPMDGLAEILSFAFNAHPFTTAELASSVEALRLWGGTLAQTGFAPDFLIAARRQEQLLRLLRHQNADGGFSAMRGADGKAGGSTIEDTAAALIALGPDTSELVRPAKELAVGWIKQQLANTWFNDRERAFRAAAYAALAAADAIDVASLHYFSDTSATRDLPPIADADIAAAFGHIHDPDAAAFWTKKMLGEKNFAKSAPLLGALAATDALSPDDVRAAMAKMATALVSGKTPNIEDAAALLRAAAADNISAGKGPMTIGGETRNPSGVFGLRLSSAAAAYRNGDGHSVSVTLVSEASAPRAASVAVTRHIYRMNGVELSSPARPLRGDVYMVEVKGAVPSLSGDEKLLLQDGEGDALRFPGCPLSAAISAPTLVPWFAMQGLTPISACEFSPHELSVALSPAAKDKAFSTAYFAYIDADSVADIPPPRLRILK